MKTKLLIAVVLLLSGCAGTSVQYEWREQPDGFYFHCVVGTDTCDTQFKAYRDTGVMI